MLDARYLDDFGIPRLCPIAPRLGPPQRGDQVFEKDYQGWEAATLPNMVADGVSTLKWRVGSSRS